MSIDMKDKEYESLRQEIMYWQQRRFLILSASIVVVTAVFSLSKGEQSVVPASIVSTILLSFLSVMCFVTAYCGNSCSKIGSYLQVFHEESAGDLNWETANYKFSCISKDSKETGSEKFSNFNLNSNLSAIYLVLGFASLVVPYHLFKSSTNYISHVAEPGTSISLVIFIIGLIYLYRSQSVKIKFISKWKDVRDSLKSDEAE